MSNYYFIDDDVGEYLADTLSTATRVAENIGNTGNTGNKLKFFFTYEIIEKDYYRDDRLLTRDSSLND